MVREKIVIIDFGSQFTQLIARKVRELGVYSEIINFKKIKNLTKNKFIKGIILSGGPLTVTDPEIIRYFMSIPEAAELVIQAGAMGQGGDVFVLDMGKPVKIKELAEKMIHLSGLQVKDEFHPEGDIEIKYTGLRAGEKLYEELLIGDNVSETDNPLIMRAKEDKLNWDNLKLLLENLRVVNDSDDHEKLRNLLIEIVPGFKPQTEISDILYTNKN